MLTLPHLCFDPSPLSNSTSLSHLVYAVCIEYFKISSISVIHPAPKNPQLRNTGRTQALAEVATLWALSSRCESTRATMIHDNTPNRVFKISELTRLIVNQLVLISQKSAVNLACACRCLEEPVLSELWGTQHELCNLLGVLPGGAWEFGPRVSSYVVCVLDLRWKN